MGNKLVSLENFVIDPYKQDNLLDTNLKIHKRGRLFNCFYTFKKDQVTAKIKDLVETNLNAKQDWKRIRKNLNV